MPQIPEYNPRITGLQPSERGTTAQVQRARRTGAFYNEAAGMISAGARSEAEAASDVARSASGVARDVGEVAKQQEEFAGHREVSAGSAAGAKLFDKLGDQWAAIKNSADPNDPSVAAKFRETVLEPSLQQFGEAYGNTDRGRQWSEQHVASMRNHFYQKTAADMSTLAGEAVKLNVRTLSNAASNAAFKSPDFHTVDYLLGKTDNDVNEIVSSSPNLRGDAGRVRMEVAERTKEQIVKAAAQGAIAKASDPEKIAADFASRYPQYINGADENALARGAKVQAKANLLQDKQIETYQRQAADQGAHKEAAKVMADNVSYDATAGRMVVKPGFFTQNLDILRKFPNAPSAAAVVHSNITWGEHQQAQKAQPITSDPGVKADLYTRMFDENKPTTIVELQKANVENKLSTHDYNAMHQLLTSLEDTPLKGPVVHDTLASVKANLTYTMPGMPGRDPKGQEAYAKFVRDFIPKYQAAVRSGNLPPNALDTSDPKSMISQSMAQFKRTPKQMLDDRTEEFSKLNINLTGEGKTITGQQIIDIPAGMSIQDAVKAYGSGKTVKLPDGRTKVLP